MDKKLLEIKDLTVSLDKKIILNNINLSIRKGEIHAILGPNGSGKTTLAQAIMGLPSYRVISGEIIFKGQNIIKLTPEKRAKLGIGLVFQNPPAIKGVTLQNLIDHLSSRKQQKISFFGEKIITSLLSRDINLGFSGGEKKISELYQIIHLNPDLVILDEIDSGLDIENLEKIIKFLKYQFNTQLRSFLIITHREDILKFLNPTMTHIFLKGNIICSSKNWFSVWQTIKKYGYEKCETCPKRIC